jgi:predicted metal-dependent peptidase
LDKYPTWQDGPIKPDQKVRVVGEDIVQPQQDEALTTAELEAVKDRLTKARTQLMLDKPFLGNLVLRLPLIAADSWCKTSATDAKSFYYNPEFIDSLNSHQIKFILIHEALHCALTHFARRGNRTKHKWDLACDFAINPLLVKEGFHPPIDVPIFRQYEGMIAEEIYPMIDDNLDQDPMDQHLYDDQANDDSKSSDGGMREDDLQKEQEQQSTPESKSNDGNKGGMSQLAQQPPALQPDEVDKLATQWQKNLASSAQLAQQAGKLDGEFAKLIDFFLQPQVSWQSLLAQYMSTFARDDFSYARPSRRPGEAIMPSLRSHQLDITVAIDTSGSISQEEIDKFVSEVDAIKANIRAGITLLACDDKLSEHSPWRFEAWDELQFPASLGGGKGTNFNPVFNYINTQDTPSDVLIYFTDAKGKFPDFEPDYPVLWLIKGKERVPWGSRIQLN